MRRCGERERRRRGLLAVLLAVLWRRSSRGKFVNALNGRSSTSVSTPLSTLLAPPRPQGEHKESSIISSIRSRGPMSLLFAFRQDTAITHLASMFPRHTLNITSTHVLLCLDNCRHRAALSSLPDETSPRAANYCRQIPCSDAAEVIVLDCG
jgi:hypothetical protein